MRLHDDDKVARYTSAGWWTDETWDGLLRGQVAARPDHVAVVDPVNKRDLVGMPAARWTWAELDRQVDGLAAVLLAEGVAAGDTIGLQLVNGVELVQAYLALQRIGAVASPFPVAFRAYELEQLGALAGITLLLTSGRIGDRDSAAEARELVDRVPSLQRVLAWGEGLPDGVVSLDDALSAEPDLQPLRAYVAQRSSDPSDCVTLCWTSGTEAVPKGVLRASNDWIAIAKGSVDGAGLGPDDVLLNPFPMVNMAGIGGMLVPWLLTGATLVQHHPFDLPTFLRQVAEERPTYTVAPPALLTMLLANEAVLAKADLSSLRVIGSGSAPLSSWMIHGWKDRFGIDVTNLFGSNEGIALIGEPSTIPDLDQRASYFPRFGGPGLTWGNRAAAGMQTRLVDLHTGAEITSAGQPGELRLTGPTVFSHYLPASAPDAHPFDEQGYFCTGDVFELVADDAGELRFLSYVDRAKDMIIRGGMNISPAEVEGLLADHQAVAEVAVVGVPDDVLGERACAFVVPREGASVTLSQLVEHLRAKRVASYKLPERVVVVDALPRNPLGKVLKRVLREGAARDLVEAGA